MTEQQTVQDNDKTLCDTCASANHCILNSLLGKTISCKGYINCNSPRANLINTSKLRLGETL